MINFIPPLAVFFIGALLMPFLKGTVRLAYSIAVCIAAFACLVSIPQGVYPVVEFWGYTLTFRFDSLSLPFAYAFIIATLIGMIYAHHLKSSKEHFWGCIYAASVMGAIFAGDLISLFIFWELMTVAAMFIIWAAGTKDSQGAGFRYLLVHLFGGLCLLAGIIMKVYYTGSIEFSYIGMEMGIASWLMLIGFMVNAAVPPLHAWLTDAYPKASVTGVIFLSAFTTKTAVYVLARAFPGTELLITLGAIMTIYPLIFIVLENDLRRVLSYSLINQIGFMIVAIGIGTPLAINGAVAHAFVHIIYKALLFMSIGAVMYRVGSAKVTDLGGLYRIMPMTMMFCVIGALSISAFPLFSGFAAKSIIVSAVAKEHLTYIWLAIMFASAGAIYWIKVPYFAFLNKDSGKRPQEAPLNMKVAMGIAALICIAVGILPNVFYSVLPYSMDYTPYKLANVMKQLLLLGFVFLAFSLWLRSGYYPRETRSEILDIDWIYRKLAPMFLGVIGKGFSWINQQLSYVFLGWLPKTLTWMSKSPALALKIWFSKLVMYFMPFGWQEARLSIERVEKEYPAHVLSPWSMSSSIAFITIFLALYLINYYFL